MCTGITDADYRKKSFDLMVDSLKLYITLATFAFGGMLAFFNGVKKPEAPMLFYVSIGSFFVCAILAVVIINMLIIRTYNKQMDPMQAILRTANFVAIGLFALGFILGALFMLAQPPKDADKWSATVVQTEKKLNVSTTDNMNYELVLDSVNKEKKIIFWPSDR